MFISVDVHVHGGCARTLLYTQTPSYLPSYTRLGHAIPGSKTVSVGGVCRCVCARAHQHTQTNTTTRVRKDQVG